jgi:High potential iron-sulfur protein
MTDKIQRRTLIKAALIGAWVPAAGIGVLREVEAAAALPVLDPNEPTAKALGYVVDATKVDARANATYKPGQSCGNCVQFQGKAADKTAACPIYPGKQVQASGWCKVWAQKPA